MLAASRKNLMRFVSVLPPLLLLFALNATAASPQTMREEALVKNYPAGSIHTVQQASAALAEVSAPVPVKTVEVTEIPPVAWIAPDPV